MCVFVFLFSTFIFSSQIDDPGDKSIFVPKLGEWVKGFTLEAETEVVCHLFGEGVFAIQFRCNEKLVKRTIEIEAAGWKSFTRELGPGSLEVMIEQVQRPEYPNPKFTGAIFTASRDFVPALEDILTPLYVRFNNSNNSDNRCFVSVACQNAARYYFNLGFVTANGFAGDGTLPVKSQTRTINLSRTVYSRTVFSCKFTGQKDISCDVEFFGDRNCTVLIRNFHLESNTPFTEYFVAYPEPNGKVRITTTEEIISKAKAGLRPDDLKRPVPKKIQVSLPINDSGEKLEYYRSELELARMIGANAANTNLGRLEPEREQMGFSFAWHANYFPIYNNWDWNIAEQKAQQYVLETYSPRSKNLDGVVMLSDEPAFVPLVKDETLNKRFISWLQEKKLTAQDINVGDLSAVDVINPAIAMNKRLSYFFHLFQMDEQINYWNRFASLFTKSSPYLRTAVNWQADLYYSGANFLDLWELYRKPGLQITWAEDWYGYMPQGSGVIAWYADLMRSQGKYRNLPMGTYPIAYAYSPCVITLNYYERLMRGCTYFHPYSYSLRGNDTPWVDSPEYTRNLAVVHRDIAEVEDMVTAGTVRRANVALLYPNSCFLFDRSAFQDALAIYLAHLHSCIPVDILTEQDMLDGYASGYKLIYVAGGCLRRDAFSEVIKFADSGGTVCIMAPKLNDQFDETIPGAARAVGAESIQEVLNEDCGRFAYEFPHSRPVDTVDWGGKKIQVFCQKSKITPANDAEILAKFPDGSPAIIKTKRGKGIIYVYGFNPALSYMHADYGDNSGVSTGLAANGTERAAAIFPAAGIARQVSADRDMISSRIIDAPGGFLIGVVDYGFGKPGREQKNLNPHKIDLETMEPYPVTLTVECRNKPESVRGVRNKSVQWKYENGKVIVLVPLRLVEMLIIRGKGL